MKEIIENFKNIVSNKYACFDGRAGQKEFWFFFLVLAVVNVILNILTQILPILGILAAIWSLGLLVPTLAVTARRLHDTGKSGWLQLLCLIPIIGSIIVLVLCIPAGDAAENQYGAPQA